VLVLRAASAIRLSSGASTRGRGGLSQGRDGDLKLMVVVVVEETGCINIRNYFTKECPLLTIWNGAS